MSAKLTRSLALISALTLTTAACSSSDGAEDPTTDASPVETTEAPEEPTEEPTTEEATTEEPTTEEATTEEPTDGDVVLGETFESANGTFSWTLPEGYEFETGVGGIEDSGYEWANGEPVQSYAIIDPAGIHVGNMNVNIATDSDGVPPAHVENVETVEIPGGHIEGYDAWLVSEAKSTCFEGEAEDPMSECEYLIFMTLVNAPEGSEPPEDAWVWSHETYESDAPGNVLMVAMVGGEGGEEPLPFTYDELGQHAESEQYHALQALFTSFTVTE